MRTFRIENRESRWLGTITAALRESPEAFGRVISIMCVEWRVAHTPYPVLITSKISLAGIRGSLRFTIFDVHKPATIGQDLASSPPQS